MVERSLSMREVRGSIPRISILMLDTKLSIILIRLIEPTKLSIILIRLIENRFDLHLQNYFEPTKLSIILIRLIENNYFD
jgi:hypothetical protein